MFSIYHCTSEHFASHIAEKLGKGKRHALLFYQAWMRRGKLPCDYEPQAKGLIEAIGAEVDLNLPEICEERLEGETRKFLLRFSDKLESESVIIPMKHGATLCISSQVGCKRGCVFCETGRMGLLRSLTVEEIIAQVYIAQHHFHAKIRNIVFMGMGEPLDNFDAVVQAIAVLTDPHGLSFGSSHITVSTSGVVDKIIALADRVKPSVNLAVSLNASNDQIRKKLMPIQCHWDLSALKEGMKIYCEKTKRKILIEYVMIEGKNCSLENAEEVASYLAGLDVTINLIPYNAQRADRFAAPSMETIRFFHRILTDRGFRVTMRLPKGQAIMAACGQLGNREQRKLRQKKRESCSMTT